MRANTRHHKPNAATAVISSHRLNASCERFNQVAYIQNISRAICGRSRHRQHSGNNVKKKSEKRVELCNRDRRLQTGHGQRLSARPGLRLSRDERGMTVTLLLLLSLFIGTLTPSGQRRFLEEKISRTELRF